MIELQPVEARSAIRGMFPQSGHTWRRAFAVLDGSSRGRCITDDPETPTWSAVQEFSDDSVVYLAGSLDHTTVTNVIEHLRRNRIVTLALADNDPRLDLIPDTATDERVDIDFEDRDPSIDIERLTSPPPDLRLARIDHDLVPRCMWSPWMTMSLDSALDHGLGYCLLDGDEVVAEAFAGPLVDGAMEMATITTDAYQRRGLAAIVCAKTILECERLGYTTWWNTSLANVASAGLARKLGYRVEQHYRAFVWEPSETTKTSPTA